MDKMTVGMLEEENFDEFFEELDQMIDSSGETTVSPDSKIDTRKWVAAYLKLESDKEWLKAEYIPHMIEKFVTPSKNKIAKIEDQQDAIKGGLQEFLEDLGDKKVNFPELGTVYLRATQKKIIYPSDEKGYIEQLVKEGSEEYLVSTPKLDKKKILQEFKDTGTVPLSGVTGEEADVAVSIRKAK